jgi:hypothetical protein
MTYITALITFVVLILLIVGYLWGPLMLSREKPSRTAGGFAPGRGCAGRRGPGGWTTFDPSYHATTASSIAHMIERSA